MTQDEIWKEHYREFTLFMRQHKRRPSKYKPDERRLVNWLKHNKKQFARGEMPEHRIKWFLRLLDKDAQYRRINQYAYAPKQEELSLF